MQELGVGKGDRVLIYLPMIAEACFAILACARIGAIHSVVFGGFAAHSLASRIDDARPKLIISADAGSRVGKVVPYKPLLDEAIRLSQFPPEKVILVNRGLAPDMARVAGRDLDWAERASALRLAGIERTLLHPLYLGYYRQAQGGAARRRRPRGCTGCIDEAHLLRQRWRDLFFHL